jgi:predicted nucleotidyltransferase
LRLFDKHARLFGCEFFLAGELAADLSMQRPPSELRATTEIEFGIAVEGPEQLNAFQRGLISTGEFVSAQGVARRLFYVDGNLYENAAGNLAWVIQVDLIPFIGSSDTGTVLRPQASPDHFLNVSGIAALRSSFNIEVEAGLVIRVGSTAALTLMALTAWVCLGQAAGAARINLARFLTDYRPEDQDRMWQLESDCIKALDYDEAFADAVFHGREIADICEAEVLEQLRSALTGYDNRRRFASEIARAYLESRVRDSSDGSSRLERIADAFCIGFVGRRQDESDA